MKQERNNIIKSIKQFLEKMIIGGTGEKSLAIIFKPLNGIEEKVTLRKHIIEDRISKLKEEKLIIDNQIEEYGIEIGRCNMYLDNVSKFT
jgi:hypothetical protein